MKKINLTDRISLIMENRSGDRKVYVILPSLLYFPTNTESSEYLDITLAWITFGLTVRIKTTKEENN